MMRLLRSESSIISIVNEPRSELREELERRRVAAGTALRSLAQFGCRAAAVPRRQVSRDIFARGKTR